MWLLGIFSKLRTFIAIIMLGLVLLLYRTIKINIELKHKIETRKTIINALQKQYSEHLLNMQKLDFQQNKTDKKYAILLQNNKKFYTENMQNINQYMLNYHFHSILHGKKNDSNRSKH